MPWSCCGAQHLDHVMTCPACAKRKPSWTVKLKNTRRLVLPTKRELGLTVELQEPPALELPVELTPPPQVTCDSASDLDLITISTSLEVEAPLELNSGVELPHDVLELTSGVTIDDDPLVVGSGVTIDDDPLVVGSGVTIDDDPLVVGSGVTIDDDPLVVGSGVTIDDDPLVVGSGVTIEEPLVVSSEARPGQ